MKYNQAALILIYLAIIWFSSLGPSRFLVAEEKGPHGLIRIGTFPFEPFIFSMKRE
jgi:hypothetical protein